ncbi:MAG: MBL fold metallo-hydrolase [Bacteroidales bacterium]|nr:MAG: MBL fold metallo-hydrolase [Bacteroidales bacterium]
MISLEKFVFNDFQVNTFILSDETKECLIVDPGCFSRDEKKELLDYINNNRLKPVKIVNTHCHVDHILGNAFVFNSFNIPSAAHKDEQYLLDGVVEHGQVFGFTVEPPPGIDEFLEDNGLVKFGKSQLNVLHVPGHSKGSIALYSPDQKFIIAGDVLFYGSIGRTDLPGGDYDVLINSIKTKILTLPEDVIVFAGHGPSTTVKAETDTNPFL